MDDVEIYYQTRSEEFYQQEYRNRLIKTITIKVLEMKIIRFPKYYTLQQRAIQGHISFDLNSFLEHGRISKTTPRLSGILE